jgi:serine/threonine-protein kinase
MLAEQLASIDDRKAFIATRGHIVAEPSLRGAPSRPSQPGTSVAGRSGASLSPEVIDLAQRKLTVYVGPIAKVVVRKAAAQAATSRQFYLILADSIGKDVDRVKFLDEVGVV